MAVSADNLVKETKNGRRNGKNIFLSGPITGKAHNNVAAFAVAAEQLRDAGAAYVYNPAHKSSNAHTERRIRMTHADYMTDTVHELTKREKRSQMREWVIPRKYDMLVLLDGWEDSDGARMERAVALECGIDVYELSDVPGLAYMAQIKGAQLRW